MSSEPQDALLTTTEAAKLLTIHPVTLNAWRLKDRGPPYRRLPGSDRIAYSRADVLAWAAGGRVVPKFTQESAQTFSCLAKRSNAERVEIESFVSGVPMTPDEAFAVIKAALREVLAEERVSK